MVDQIQQAIDVIIPWMDDIVDGNEEEEDCNENEKIIDISGYNNNVRPLYLIKRKKYFESIRKQLQAKNRLLLKTFNTYAFYSCEITEMEEKILQHMTNTGAYKLIIEFNETNRQCIENYLNKIDKHIKMKLNNLLQNRSITLTQWQKMKPNECSGNRFDSLYFLPNTCGENVPLYPLINNRHDLTRKLIRFLSHLLQPIYDRITLSMTFNTAADVMDTMENYIKKGFLQPTTLFATVHIYDLSTGIVHEQIIEYLQRFLSEYVIDGRLQGISIQNILDLIRLILENEYILYDHKLYQQIRGSYLNLSLTKILTNIYIYYWQQDLVTILNKKNEIFGRCFDQIFLTWNESEENLRTLLNTMIIQYPDMQMKIIINTKINYLDMNISHLDGNLQTQVVHDLNVEPYALPFVLGHRKYQYNTLLQAALIRAVQCCINVFDCANELEDLQLSFQYNRFPKDFFIEQFQLFLKEFHSAKLKKLLYGEQYYDQSHYDYLRQIVFNNNQSVKKAKIKRLQRQTIQYRWKHI